jgi:hypothetical protein
LKPPQTLIFAAVCILLILATACGNDEPKTQPISGKVIDAYDKSPVANVIVKLIENGPSATTNDDGSFSFSEVALSTGFFEEIDEDGISGVAVFLNRNGYRPRELNVAYGVHEEIKLTRDSVPAYVYYKPVQLNDGLLTSAMADIGMDRQVIQNLMDRMYNFEYQEIHSLLVYKDDRLVMEEYFYGNNDTINFENNITVDRNPAPIQWTRTEPHYIASVNKGLTATLVGIALDQNDLDTDTKIADYLPKYADYFNDSDKAWIDFENCLNMTSGLKWDEWGSNDLALLWQSDDFADFALSRPSLGPAFEWRYNSALPNILLKAVSQMVGAPVRTWAHDNFYSKLGIHDYKWQSQPDGFPEGAARMYLRPRDMLKIGITYLNDGQWKGEQVVPEEWVRSCFSVKEVTESGDYSYHFWLRSLDGVNYVSLDGDGGNYINIFPDQNMVIVVTQGNYLKWPFYVTQVDNIMKDYIFKSLPQ